jgi:hypothetical protein
LGHGSEAVHRGYAKNAKVLLPPLYAFEESARARNIIALPTTPNAMARELRPAVADIASL